jgi:hypothetical protein
MKTPFLHSFNLLEIKLCRPLLHNILLLWNEDVKKFVFREVELSFTTEEKSVIGIPYSGDEINCDCSSDEQNNSKIHNDYFQNKGVITKAML